MKKPPIKPTYYFDTPEGINQFTKILYEDNEQMTEAEYKKMNRDTKLATLKDEYKNLKPYNNYDKTTYPTDPEQRRRLFNISKLEKDLGIKGDNFTRFVKTGAIPVDTQKKKPDLWQDVIYKSMTPIEKGQFNNAQRKKGINPRTGEPIKSKPIETPSVAQTVKPSVEPQVEPTVKSNEDINQIIKDRIRKKDEALMRTLGKKPGGIVNMDLILGFNEDFFRKKKG